MQVSLQIFASPLEGAHAQWGSGLLPPASSELSLLVAGSRHRTEESIM